MRERLQAAREMQQTGNVEGAIGLYEEILTGEPNSTALGSVPSTTLHFGELDAK